MFSVLSAIAVQIPHLDQFRWPGWFISVYTSFIFIVTIVLFREKMTDINRKGGKCGIQEISVPYYVSLNIMDRQPDGQTLRQIIHS